MKRIALIVLGLLIVIGAVLVFTRSDNHPMSSEGSKQGNSSQPAQSNEVLIQNFAFAPSKLTVKKGTTVTWTNRDDAHHDITPDTPSNDFMASNLLSKGQSYQFTFNTIGTYSYHCSPHPYIKATIEVTE